MLSSHKLITTLSNEVGRTSLHPPKPTPILKTRGFPKDEFDSASRCSKTESAGYQDLRGRDRSTDQDDGPDRFQS